MNVIKRAIRPEQIREFVLLLLIAGVVIFFSTQIENFASGRTFTRIATSVAVVARLWQSPGDYLHAGHDGTLSHNPPRLRSGEDGDDRHAARLAG